MEHHKGLAENILIELNVRLKTHFQEIDDLDQLKEDIQVLSCVAKRRVEIGDVGKMLESFSVGTDQTKGFPGEPRPESVRPIRQCRFISPMKIVEGITSSYSCINTCAAPKSDESTVTPERSDTEGVTTSVAGSITCSQLW